MARGRLRPGEVLDGFTVGEFLHEGGMACLYSCTSPLVTDVPLLMKVPNLEEGEDTAHIVGFEMEQMIMPRLEGRHVPRFVAAGDVTVNPYIVMERIAGHSLLALRDNLPLRPEEVSSIGARVATALHELHRQHVVHLDVKPSNVILRPDGVAALVDFGLSRHEQLPDLLGEQFRLPYGTAPYMAPEQVLGRRGDPRSDLFALGVLLYFYATGVRPFGEPRGLRQMKRRLWRDPVPPRKLRPDLPKPLQEIILRCLEADPARRHPTAAQLAVDLENPAQVKLTARAEKLEQDTWGMVTRRRFNPDFQPPVLQNAAAAQLSKAPIVAVAIDLGGASEALAEALRVTVGRMLEIAPGARLACVNVLKQHRLAVDLTVDDEGRNKHLARMIELKHWAQPLQKNEQRVSFHVLEAIEPAAAILEFARTNRVDHIVLGARTDSALRNLLGSVSAEVVANAPCSVTVVRPPTSQRA
jgi:serine/threonine protein kinase